MVKDPLSDLLVRIRNAQAVGRPSTMVPYTAFVWEVAKLLERQGYIGKIERRGKRIRRMLEVNLAYSEEGKGRISSTRRISKQSQRVYKKAAELHPVKHGFGAQIISTSKGLMTDREARRAKLGGEVLFEIW